MSLLERSFSGAVFAAAVLIIRGAAIHVLPKKTFPVLWEAVLLRMLVPFAVPSALSIYTLVGRGMRMPPSVEAETDSAVDIISQEHFFILYSAGRVSTESQTFSVWPVVWCAGMAGFALFFSAVYLRCRMEFRTALPVDNAYVRQWLRERPLRRRISVRQSDRVSTPLTYGIFRPVILMPKQTDWGNVEQLQYIFAHEYVHIRRLDVFRKLTATFVLCIHWFNPLVWAMYIFFNRDMELVCDESVVKQFGEKARAGYSLMLIDMEADRDGTSPFYSSFSKNAVKERVTAIMKTKQTTFAAFLAAGFTVSAAVVLFATSAAASAVSGPSDRITSGDSRTGAGDISADKDSAMSIIHESADILHYENGAPYIHDVLTNNTGKTIAETQYCMLAYDESGSPLELCWNFLDSSAGSSFENVVRAKENILPGQTEEYQGGWSLYDRESMGDFSGAGEDESNRAAYVLFCLEQVVFEDGTVWHNPEYEGWLRTYAGREIGVEVLEGYYPCVYGVGPESGS